MSAISDAVSVSRLRERKSLCRRKNFRRYFFISAPILNISIFMCLANLLFILSFVIW